MLAHEMKKTRIVELLAFDLLLHAIPERHEKKERKKGRKKRRKKGWLRAEDPKRPLLLRDHHAEEPASAREDEIANLRLAFLGDGDPKVTAQTRRGEDSVVLGIPMSSHCQRLWRVREKTEETKEREDRGNKGEEREDKGNKGERRQRKPRREKTKETKEREDKGNQGPVLGLICRR